MAIEHFRIEGLADLELALAELPKATARNVVKRVLLKHAEPMAASAKAGAPDDPETGGFDLHTSVTAGTKLSRRQRKTSKKESDVEVYVGAGPLPQAHLTEFGSRNNRPVGFMRAAFDGGAKPALEGIRDDLAEEIEKTRARVARKAERLAASMK